MEILKGAEVSAKIKEQAAQMLSRLGEHVPKLAIVRVGERPDDMSYERAPQKRWRASDSGYSPMCSRKMCRTRSLNRNFIRSTVMRM